jgi:arylsulfatase A-like enzyme
VRVSLENVGLVLLANVFGLPCLPEIECADDSRPNVVFIVTDDQAPWAAGYAFDGGQYSGVPRTHTPHLDRLSREGAVFGNLFCTTPVCSPARAALATGKYASEFGIRDFIPQPGHRLYGDANEMSLDPDRSTTFAELLQRNGYRTGLVGKWHLGDWTASGRQRNHPRNHGFDYFMGLTGGGTSPVDPQLEIDGELQQFKGLTTDILTDHALDFIRKANDAPFLLCLHTRAPHGNWLPVADSDWDPYENLDPVIPQFPDLDVRSVKRWMREYLASTTGVDRNLGRILEALDRLGLSQRTVVIFTSDHGYNMGHNGIWHKGNGIWATHNKPPGKVHNGTRVISDKYRPNLYDLSLRVPAVVRWPGVIRPGTKISHTAVSVDFFPTILELAGVEDTTRSERPGRSLVPLLRGDSVADWNQDLYAEYDMIHYAVASMRCYRTPQYKLIRDLHNAGRDEFYDLQNDPQESNNLIADSRREIQLVIQDLQRKLTLRMQLSAKRVSVHAPARP